MRLALALALALAACGSNGTDACANDACACTAAAQHSEGTALVFTPVTLTSSVPNCSTVLVSTTAQLAAAFPNDDAPPEILAVDLSVDRIVMGSSNPQIDYAVDDGMKITVGQEMLCQGVAPQCMAYIVRATTRDTLGIQMCPYTGPDPCLAP